MVMVSEKGQTVVAGDVLKGWSGEEWVFLRVLDAYSVEVAWGEQRFQMPVNIFGGRVVYLPRARA